MALGPGSITLHTLCKKHASQLDMQAISSAGQDVASYLNQARTVLSGAGYSPYYSYKQKYAVSGGENTGYCLNGHECIYNIYMMNDRCDILAAGAGSSSKLIGAGTKTYHIYSPKDYLLYTKSPQEIISKKMKSLNDALIDRLSRG